MNSMFLELLRNCSNEAITLKKTYLKSDWLPYKLSEGSQKHSRNTFASLISIKSIFSRVAVFAKRFQFLIETDFPKNLYDRRRLVNDLQIFSTTYSEVL